MTIILSQLDEETEGWLQSEAARTGKSVEVIIQRLVQDQLQQDQRQATPTPYHDLDHLAGTWSEEETNAFLDAIEDFE